MLENSNSLQLRVSGGVVSGLRQAHSMQQAYGLPQ